MTKKQNSANLPVVFFGVSLIGLLLAPSPSNACVIPGNPEAGRAVYEQTCIACHGANGKPTIPGLPDLSKKNGPLAQKAEVLLPRITQGYRSGKAPMAMPPKGGNPDLSEADIENVLGYMRKTFGC